MAALLPRILHRALRSAFAAAVYASLAFLGAGRLAWPRGWIYAGISLGMTAAGSVIVECANPGLLAARAKGIRKDTKPFDKLFYALFLPLVLIFPLLAGADAVRFARAPLPEGTVYAGLALYVLGSVLTTWTMVVNRHAESTVRIHGEQTVVTSGPYAIVRHPMYAGIIVSLPGGTLILGSGWALVPVILMVLLFVWRTAREDRALHEELAGYTDYAKTTRFRLIPGIW